jgi:hypothetical protein
MLPSTFTAAFAPGYPRQIKIDRLSTFCEPLQRFPQTQACFVTRLLTDFFDVEAQNGKDDLHGHPDAERRDKRPPPDVTAQEPAYKQDRTLDKTAA